MLKITAMKNKTWSCNLGLLIDYKLSELGKLGGASKQLSKRKMHRKLERRCHIAMAYIVNDLKRVKSIIFEAHPEMEDLFASLEFLYRACENGFSERYINERKNSDGTR